MNKTILITLPFLLICCSTPYKSENGEPIKYDYDDIPSKIEWNDIFSQEEKEYKVYFFSRTCAHCSNIKDIFLKYYFSYVENVYISETDENTVFGPLSDLTGIDKIEDFYIFGTPFLVNIKNWTVTYYYSGEKAIREYISKIIVL